MKILLIEPGMEYPNVVANTGMHLGLLRIAAAIHSKYPQIELVFWSAQFAKLSSSYPQTIVDVCKNWLPDCCFISALTCQIDEAYAYCKQLHTLGCKTVVLGGAFASSARHKCLENLPEFDYVTAGAGENPSVQIVEDILTSQTRHGVFLDNRSNVFSDAVFCERPLYEIFPHHIATEHKINASIELSRGCNNNCSFCTLVERSRGIAYETPQTAALYEKEFVELGYKKLMICDDTFCINREKTINQLNVMQSVNGSGLEKIVLTRIDLITDDLVSLFLKHNVKEVMLGVEHVDSKMLQSMNKTRKPDTWTAKVVDALQRLSDNEIVAHPIYMLGWSGETQSSLERLVDFAVEHGQNPFVQPFVSFCTPHPGSGIWKHRKELGLELLPASFASYTHLSPVAYPTTLGNSDSALRRLVEAHNRIRVETHVQGRNPVIDFNSAFIPGDMNKILRWE